MRFHRDVQFAVLIAASGLLLAGRAGAADSQTAACLAASSASLRYDNEHRLRDERAALLACATATCPTDIRNECIRRVDEVTLALPTILFEAKDEAGNDLSAVKVTMDSEVLVDRLDGFAIAIDPGAHTFTFEAAGHPTVKKQFVIRQGHKNRNELITFAAMSSRPGLASQATATAARSAQVDLATPAPTPPSSPPPSSEATTPSSARKTMAVVAATLGVVGIGLGAVFGWQALTKRNEARKVCPNTCLDQDAVRKWHDAKQAGNISTGAFIAGGVGLAGAALLWLTADPEQDTAPRAGIEVGPAEVSVALRGRW